MPDAAVDNDVLIKAACYGLAAELDGSRSLGVLGAAKYVIAGRIERMTLSGDRDAARTAALDLIARSLVLEPSRDELELAATIETSAQRQGLELDAGESQLAAMIVHRGIGLLETGDKRAIKGFEVLLDEFSALARSVGGCAASSRSSRAASTPSATTPSRALYAASRRSIRR